MRRRNLVGLGRSKLLVGGPQEEPRANAAEVETKARSPLSLGLEDFVAAFADVRDRDFDIQTTSSAICGQSSSAANALSALDMRLKEPTRAELHDPPWHSADLDEGLDQAALFLRPPRNIADSARQRRAMRDEPV